MTKIDERKVVVHNDLILNVVSKMDIVPLKIFELIVSAVDTDNPPIDCKLYLSKNEVYSFFNADDTNRSNRFKEHFINLHKQTIFEEKIENGKTKRRILSPFRVTEWYDEEDQDVISILVEEKFLPYLIDLKNNFTQYMISDIGKFRRKYSITLYRWLMMKWNQYKRYGNEDLKNPSIIVKELRILTDTTKDYKKWQHFEQRIIKDSLEEINEHTQITVNYELIKKGRSYSEIKFFIEEKEFKRTSEYILDKSERYEERFEKSQEKINNSLDEYLYALRDPFIERLIKQEIIHSADMEEILNIYENIVPLYKDMIDIKGRNFFNPYETFENHVAYIKDHIVGSPNKFHNIVEYLRVSAEGYNDRLRRQMNENN